MSLKLPQSSGLFKVTLSSLISSSYNFQDGYKSLQGTDEGIYPEFCLPTYINVISRVEQHPRRA